jgi:hypothetical protein
MNYLIDEVNHCIYVYWHKKNKMPTTLILDKDKYEVLHPRCGFSYRCRQPNTDTMAPRYFELALRVSPKQNHISVE